MLLFKAIPYSLVRVERIPPRPALQQLGVTYRRIPVLAIGANLYFDTSLAIQALERLSPDRTLSGDNWGLEQAAAFHWHDRAIFALAGALIPWDLMPAEFRKDRAKFGGRGDDINPAQMKALQPATLSALSSHLALVETQLANRKNVGGGFLTGTKDVTYLDLSLFFVLNWIAGFPAAASVFPKKGTQPFPRVQEWLGVMRDAVKAKEQTTQGQATPLSAEEAAKQIRAAFKDGACGVKADDAEPLLVAKYLALGEQVKVTPTDSGKVAQVGKLVALDAAESVIRVDSEGGSCFVHAPRLGFEVTKA